MNRWMNGCQQVADTPHNTSLSHSSTSYWSLFLLWILSFSYSYYLYFLFIIVV
jgi:hypothetical protein